VSSVPVSRVPDGQESPELSLTVTRWPGEPPLSATGSPSRPAADTGPETPGERAAEHSGAESSAESSERATRHGRRPALDGLRALAVLAVMVYHFGNGDSSWLRGGFLGVDVFFVLSGYLITGLLLDEQRRRGTIDLVGFWARRLRRLFPAMVLMLIAVAGWVWWATPPDSYPSRRGDIFWTLGYLANWHMIGSSDDYFAAYTSASPLRHTWSLAVEEQFYLVWPSVLFVMLWLAMRLRRRHPRINRYLPLTIVAAVGLLLSAWAMAATFDPVYPSRAYYETQGRVQELFVGVLLAIAFRSVAGTRRRLVRVLGSQAGGLLGRILAGAAWAGLVLLVGAIVVMNDGWAFYYQGGALLVSLATAAVIAELERHPEGRMARAFSWRPAVGLGRISYGVYLWHWPLVVAIPVQAVMTLHERVEHQAERFVSTMLIATASYFLLEQPVLKSRWVFRTPRRVLAAAVAAVALVVAVAVPATALPGTLARQVSQTSDRACPGERLDHLTTCVWPSGTDTTTSPVKLALLGDSTARAMSAGLDDWANETHSSWVEAAWKRCSSTGALVLPDGESTPDVPATTCTRQAPSLITATLARYHPQTVLIAEFWPNYQRIISGGTVLAAGTAAHDAVLKDDWLKVVDQVAAYGGKVVFVELPPPGASLGKSLARGRPAEDARSPVPGGGKYVDEFNAVMQSVADARPRTARTVDVDDVVCPDGTVDGQCSALTGQTLIRVDGVHYSIPFARKLVPVIMQRAGLEPAAAS
jgi:peptidoglycan/LPS O-acetylase OafA/YrhL